MVTVNKQKIYEAIECNVCYFCDYYITCRERSCDITRKVVQSFQDARKTLQDSKLD